MSRRTVGPRIRCAFRMASLLFSYARVDRSLQFASIPACAGLQKGEPLPYIGASDVGGTSAMNKNNTWDTSYEWKAVALLGVGFGLVGLDRWIIAPLFPFIAQDLGLAEGEIGRLSGTLGVLWGVFAIFSGRLSDKIGHRKVLIPAILLFSLMSGLSGMVSGPNGSDSDSRAHGRDGGDVLPDELHRGGRRLEAGAPRVQSRSAAERFCTARIRARSDHRDAAAERRAVMALGVLDRRNPWFHHRRAVVLRACASRKTRRRAS